MTAINRALKEFVQPEPASDISGALGRFAEALAIVKVVARALEADERSTEASALQTGLIALGRVYDELDLLGINRPLVLEAATSIPPS